MRIKSTQWMEYIFLDLFLVSFRSKHKSFSPRFFFKHPSVYIWFFVSSLLYSILFFVSFFLVLLLVINKCVPLEYTISFLCAHRIVVLSNIDTISCQFRMLNSCFSLQACARVWYDCMRLSIWCLSMVCSFSSPHTLRTFSLSISPSVIPPYKQYSPFTPYTLNFSL